jgi:hypothetical protein
VQTAAISGRHSMVIADVTPSAFAAPRIEPEGTSSVEVDN